MNMKDFAWNVFSKSGSVEAYLLYRQEEEYLKKAGNMSVCDYTGSCSEGSQGGGQ